eukprot:980526_1
MDILALNNTMVSFNQLRALARPSKASTSGANPNPTCWIRTRWNSMIRIYQITDCGKTVSDKFMDKECLSMCESSQSKRVPNRWNSISKRGSEKMVVVNEKG